MGSEKNRASKLKVWQEPQLEQLTVDLTAIAQRRRGNTDARGVGSVS